MGGRGGRLCRRRRGEGTEVEELGAGVGRRGRHWGRLEAAALLVVIVVGATAGSGGGGRGARAAAVSKAAEEVKREQRGE